MKTKARDLEVLFPVWHDFETDLNFFKLSNQEIFDMATNEYRVSKDFLDNQVIFLEVFYEMGISGIEAQHMVSKMRHNVPELATLLYSLGLMDDKKEGEDCEGYEALAKLLVQDILLITKIDAVVHTLNSCHFFVSGVMSSVMKIVGCKKLAFRLAKNIFATRALLDSEPVQMIDIQNILECLTPLFRELFEGLCKKNPYGQDTHRVGQLVEVFEAMSTFIGIKTPQETIPTA